MEFSFTIYLAIPARAEAHGKTPSLMKGMDLECVLFKRGGGALVVRSTSKRLRESIGQVMFWLGRRALQDRRECAAPVPAEQDWWAQAEIYSRSMGEGWVDERSTKELNQCIPVGTDPLVEDEVECAADPTGCDCSQSGYALFDFNFENLCVAALGGRWMTTLPSVTTDRLSSSQIREDKPQGFGPLPNTLTAGELYNQVASSIDLLTKVRIMLPHSLQYRQRVYSDGIGIDESLGSVECSSTGCPGKIAWYGQGPPATTLGSESGWLDAAGVLGARVESGFSDSACNPPGDFGLVTSRIALDFRFSLIDPEAANAVPESWRDMLDTDVGTMFCVQTYDIIRQVDPDGTSRSNASS